jgi:RNA polymerase sigma factor (sigma-70 family)
MVMSAAGGGDDDFEEAFREVWPLALAVARRVLGDAGEAEDAAADGFARALVAWPRVRDLPYRDAWMLRVVGNVSLDRARSRTRAARWASSSTGGDCVSDHQEVTVLRMALVEALAALPKRQREVIVLRHLCGLTEREVAGAIGISTNSVKKHASRGIARLRDRLGQPEEEIDLAI